MCECVCVCVCVFVLMKYLQSLALGRPSLVVVTLAAQVAVAL